ncbi:aminotransferase class V-fold PLP-dependent enzyme [Adonisia turfae]|uniref:Aminotransferase class V-fold PLP-dependent enzyme n=1 Tax=Adonisia turfae CCMR0081 TaxID=2292702 RepID=A0A6M0RT89_9CYAN|nr:aminotransferase class V-fold PLP-dependent enzyme [Adonisia turfae]NEZ59386.1 aminotransferase class V-fold PLP-dependent enzyme [Adonisia turfae CCMR0081]
MANFTINALIDRSNYPSLNDSVYLNQASLGLIGQPAVQSMHDFLDKIARHGNLRMTDEEEVGFFESLRQRGARLLNCSPDRLAIIASASELLGQLPFLIRPTSGSCIVAVSTDFPAITRPWIRYAEEHDCALRFVDDIATENLTDGLIDNIDSRTAVVAISSVQFSTGTMVDIPRLREACGRVDARLVVDVTQAAGILKIDSQHWQADAVVTSGYKWLGGHGGVAIATVAPGLLEQDTPLPGWMGTTNPFDFDATTLTFATGARRFTQSTMSYISMVGLTTALENLMTLSAGQREAHSRRLAHRLIQGTQTYGWTPFRALETPSASPHIVTLAHSEFDVERARDALRRNRIVCGTRNGRIRISLAPYNNSVDIDALVDVLATLES